jgi:hypothetical protein
MTIRTLPKNSQGPQQALFHEDLTGALAGLVAALGGAKTIGSRLFPDLPIESAARRLLDALNPDRQAVLSPTQLLTLLRWGREAGCHGAMEYLADEAGYTRPAPRSPEEERADLQRQVIEMGQRLEVIARKLQR